MTIPNRETAVGHESAAVGQSVARVDARAKVTGEALYPGDMALPGMLHAVVLFAGRPHARVLEIDAARAERVPGVVAVFTAKDVPVNEYGLQTKDQPVLCGPGSAKPGTDIVRFVGDQVAVIVAESEEAALLGRASVRVDYEDLPVLTDPMVALGPSAPLLHPVRLPNPIHPELCTEGNLISQHRIRKGDLDAGWSMSDVVVEGEYVTPPQEHAYLQPEAGVAAIDDEGRVTVYVAGQWTWEDQQAIAHSLGLLPEQVRVVYPAIGGAFGGREDMSVQIVLALAAWKLRRPVKMVWSREESILGHCKRHPVWLRCAWGATRDGRLVAAQVRALSDGGAYCYTTNKVMGNLAVTCTGPYEIPNIHVDVDAVYTNNVPSGAFRGFGAPQGSFAAESQMSKLAVVLGMDPVELRMRNLLRDSSLTAMGTPLPGGVGLVEATEACATAAGWRRIPVAEHGEPGRDPQWQKPLLAARPVRLTPPSLFGEEEPVSAPPAEVRRGIGFAVAFKNVGFSFGYQENCWAKVELRGEADIDQALVYIGSAEVGQGAHTAIQQMAADALGVSPDRVRVAASDTASSPGSSGSASSSRMTLMAGSAVTGAARKALEKWHDEERPAVAEYTYLAPETTPFDPVTGHGTPNFAYGYVAQAVEVEVDVETGLLRVARVVCADDVGKAVNPVQVEGQIEGAIAQAVGWATCERFVVSGGQVLTPNLSTYLIPCISDVPEQVVSVIIENPDPRMPWGVRGVGEMPFIPLAPALTAAIHDATGVWFDKLPLSPERLRSGLKQGLGHTGDD